MIRALIGAGLLVAALAVGAGWGVIKALTDETWPDLSDNDDNEVTL